MLSVTVPVWPSRILASPDRLTWSCRTPAASTQSATMAAAISASAMTRAGMSRNASVTSVPISAAIAARPVSAICPAWSWVLACLARGYRGTGTEASTPSSTPSAVTPSSSASGRSCTRCRKVGRASVLTSSGVT